MKLRGHYEKRSEKRVREKAEAIPSRSQASPQKLQREGLLPMKPRVVPGTTGSGDGHRCDCRCKRSGRTERNIARSRAARTAQTAAGTPG